VLAVRKEGTTAKLVPDMRGFSVF
jgi:predicted membrane metal-binding protein